MNKKKKETSRQDKLIAERLKKIFMNKSKELGLTYDSAGEILGDISAAAVGHYLNGYNTMNGAIKYKFAKMLGVEISDFDPDFNYKQIIDLESGTAIKSTAPKFDRKNSRQVQAIVNYLNYVEKQNPAVISWIYDNVIRFHSTLIDKRIDNDLKSSDADNNNQVSE